MKKEEIINLLNLDDNDNVLDKISDKIDLENDIEKLFEAFRETGKMYLAVKFVNNLTKSGNVEFLEKNIEYVPAKLWKFFKYNNEFKTVLVRNFDRVVKNNDSIEFSDIKHIVDKDKEEEFYKKNILKLIDVIKNEMGFFIGHLINETDFGEELLRENQVYLFSKLDYIWSLLDCLKYELGIDTKIFLKGIVENFEYITQKEKFHFLQHLDIVKDMTQKSDLEEKEIQDIKEKVQKVIVKDEKLDIDLVEDIAKLNNAQTVDTIRYFGVDKQVLKKEQNLFLKSFKWQKIIEYIVGCKKYEGIPDYYTVKELVQQVFYGEEAIKNDVPTLYAIERLIIEIAEAQELSPFDLENAGQGAYSTNFKIGDFILKVGKIRETRKIPYHKRIMQPIIRQETNPGIRNNLCIELQNIGEVNWYNGMNEDEIIEELYKLYAELRSAGIYWTDIKKTNVVRLLRPNKLNFKLNGKEIERNENSVEMMNLKDEEPLPSGELVIVDTDYLCYENEYNESLRTPSYPLVFEFEKRYKKEHKNTKEEVEFE